MFVYKDNAPVKKFDVSGREVGTNMPWYHDNIDFGEDCPEVSEAPVSRSAPPKPVAFDVFLAVHGVPRNEPYSNKPDVYRRVDYALEDASEAACRLVPYCISGEKRDEALRLKSDLDIATDLYKSGRDCNGVKLGLAVSFARVLLSGKKTLGK